MGVDPKSGRYCDECGRQIEKAIRTHAGKDYCRACYQITFVRMECSKCNGAMRAHYHSLEDPICRRCERSTRTCFRCGKFTPRAGKLIGKSAVCKACSPYFREQQPCPQCGRLSSTLSRPLSLGILEAICAKCRNRLTHATCVICTKYRRVERRDDSGRPFCAPCNQNPKLTHTCPKCAIRLPGGGSSMCPACTLTNAVERDAALINAQLEFGWIRNLWQDFVSANLSKQLESPRMRRQIERSAMFFLALDRSFPRSEDVNSTSMLELLGSKFLRSHLLASRFTIEQLALRDLGPKRGLLVEQQRLENILVRSSKMRYAALLKGYSDHLGATVASRTKRLYLRAAEAFCSDNRASSETSWTNAQLLGYLKANPGMGASLARFVSYCRLQFGWQVSMPPKPSWLYVSKSDRRVKKLRRLLEITNLTPKESLPMIATARILSLALDVPTAQLLRERTEGRVRKHANGDINLTNDATIAPNHTLYEYALRWLSLSHHPTRAR